jgi:PAS domain S-box-containing protein
VSDPLPDALFRVIVERSGVPFVVVDAHGTIVHAGEGTGAIVGWTAAQVLGRNMAEFLAPADFELALAGIAEIDSVERIEASVPIVVPIRGPDGRSRHTEVAAVPLPDIGGQQLIALRLRSWESERHLSRFVRTLLAGATLDDILEALSYSLAASMEAVGAAVHDGFDGERFRGVVGSWRGASHLPLQDPRWIEALSADEVLEVPADDD